MARAFQCCAVLIVLAAAVYPMLPYICLHLFYFGTQTLAKLKNTKTVRPKQFPSVIYSEINGVSMIPFMTQSRFDWMETDFKHLPGDVWVVTYPKTGTTWTLWMVHQIQGLAPGVPPSDEVFSLESQPWPELDFGPLACSSSSLNGPQRAPYRALKSHAQRMGYLAKLPAASKIVYVTRGVVGAFESFYEMARGFKGEHLLDDFPYDLFFDLLMSDAAPFGNYFTHVASWWAARNHTNLLILRYEDLRKDHVGSVRRLAAHIGVELNSAGVDQVVSRSTKSAMSSGEADDPVLSWFKWAGIKTSEHIRSDKNRIRLTSEEQLQRLEAEYERSLVPLGVPREYIFP